MSVRLKQAERRAWPLVFGAWLLIGPAGAAELPQVVILATGGTIAGQQKKPGEAGYVPGQLAVDALIEAVPELREIAQVKGTQPVIGLVRERVVAEGGEAAKAAAAVSPGEAADRHGQAVDEHEGGVVSRAGREVLPKRVLHRPQVGRLAQEGGAMDRAQAGEQVAEVGAEVGVQPAVGVEAEELARDLDRQHLAVHKDRRRAALAQPTSVAQVADEVVDDAEHGDDEGLQIHGRGPRRLLERATAARRVRLARPPPLGKPAHRVS